MYLGGIAQLLKGEVVTGETAFLSFILMVTATDALAGYRYASTIDKPGKRFNAFVRGYYPPEYAPFAIDGDNRLYKFRCRLVHGFSPAGFALVHHAGGEHLTIEGGTGNPFLNAEDFFGALLSASRQYFAEVRSDLNLRQLFIKRLGDRKQGGSIGVNRALTTGL